MDSSTPAEPIVESSTIPEQVSEVGRQQVFEQLETQQYQLVLPAEYEELRGYLENDGLLSDEEITKCLYDESLRRNDLAKLIEEKVPMAEKPEQKKLTDYLWDVHQDVKGLPLDFVDPKQTYRIDIVDAGTAPVQPLQPAGSINHQDRSTAGIEVSPVTLHLDINGGFLANFLHNARLNHEQMNRFIGDLERQHTELKAQVAQSEQPRIIPEQRVTERPTPEQPYQLLQESGPTLSPWQRVRQAVSDWIAPSVSDEARSRQPTQKGPVPYDLSRPQKEPPDESLSQPRSRGLNQMQETVSNYALKAASLFNNVPPRNDSKQPDRLAADQTTAAPQQTLAPLITNQQTQSTVMKETITPSAESPTEGISPGRQTRYQWSDVAPQFEKIGINRQDLEKAGQLEDLLNGRKTGLMKLTQTGEECKPFQISGKLYIVNTPDKGPIIGIQPERKQLLLPKEFLGYELTTRDKQNLEKNGEMGKRVELTDKMTGKQFTGYVGVDKETRSLTVLRAERLHIPQTVKGVTLTKQQQKNLEQGRAVKLEGMTSNNGQTFNAYVQVSAAKRSLTFAKIPDNAVKQTVDQKTAQDLTKPVHQLKGDGAGGKKTIQPKPERRPDEAKQAAAQRVETPKPAKQQKMAAPKPALEENKPKRTRKQKGPGLS